MRNRGEIAGTRSSPISAVEGTGGIGVHWRLSAANKSSSHLLNEPLRGGTLATRTGWRAPRVKLMSPIPQRDEGVPRGEARRAPRPPHQTPPPPCRGSSLRKPVRNSLLLRRAAYGKPGYPLGRLSTTDRIVWGRLSTCGRLPIGHPSASSDCLPRSAPIPELPFPFHQRSLPLAQTVAFLCTAISRNFRAARRFSPRCSSALRLSDGHGLAFSPTLFSFSLRVLCVFASLRGKLPPQPTPPSHHVHPVGCGLPRCVSVVSFPFAPPRTHHA